MNRETANVVVSQLGAALGVLNQGRSLGIRVVATASAIEGLRQSDHPWAQQVIAHMVKVTEVPESYSDHYHQNRFSEVKI